MIFLQMPIGWKFSKLGKRQSTAAHSEYEIVYGDGMLVSMPKPDFSMPFNVITLTSTVVVSCMDPYSTLSSEKGKEEKRSRQKR